MKNLKRLWILALAATLLFGCGGDAQGPSDKVQIVPYTGPDAGEPSNPVALPNAVVGQPAPNFTLKNMDGESVSLSDYAGDPVFIYFWASWCAPCHASAPSMQELYERFEDDGFTVLAISLDDPFDPEGRAFVRQYGWTFPTLIASVPVVDAYEIEAIPATFVVNSDGVLVQKWHGKPLGEMIGIVQDLLMGFL